MPPKRRFLQEPHGVTSQKTPFFDIPNGTLSHRHVSILSSALSDDGKRIGLRNLLYILVF
jgi:hypothetical protein